jgi:hypothetical protein
LLFVAEFTIEPSKFFNYIANLHESKEEEEKVVGRRPDRMGSGVVLSVGETSFS